MTENELVPCQFRINEKAFYTYAYPIKKYVKVSKYVTFMSLRNWKLLAAVSVTDLDSISLSFLGGS